MHHSMQVHSGTVKVSKGTVILILWLLDSAIVIFSYTYYVMLTAASKIIIKYVTKISHSLFTSSYYYVHNLRTLIYSSVKTAMAKVG